MEAVIVFFGLRSFSFLSAGSSFFRVSFPAGGGDAGLILDGFSGGDDVSGDPVFVWGEGFTTGGGGGGGVVAGLAGGAVAAGGAFVDCGGDGWGGGVGALLVPVILAYEVPITTFRGRRAPLFCPTSSPSFDGLCWCTGWASAPSNDSGDTSAFSLLATLLLVPPLSYRIR